MTDVGWYRRDDLDDLDEDMRQRIALALPPRGEARFI